jgi:hypothetical protein
MPETAELLAQAVHRLYLEQRLAQGERLGSTPSLVEWEELPEAFKDSSREQACHTRRLLAQIGCEPRPARRGLQGTQLTDEEVEILARLAHERWLDERRRLGWRFGSQRDDVRKLHRDIVPWEELSDDRREIDRYMMREFPRILASLGLVLVRQSTSNR